MRKLKELPTQEYLKECLDYNPETGLLTWKVRPPEHFKTARAFKIWNKRYSEKLALNHVDSNKYCGGHLDNVRHLAHRIIWKWWYGEDPNFILHENGNTTDNRIEKLSSDTHQKNMKDQKKQTNNSSGITGVCWHKQSNKWVAEIRHDKLRKYLGIFEDFFEACCARKAAEFKYGFHPGHGTR